ncbi:hypothetical protein J5N97_026891 [Dioscorea zingiberensis]|uniref:CWF21 domain-containing protein n=1 Tax=Dioscorea zingiberensis TaxID=325984 RepID=A0A9D5C3V2_9LILI|nr:hypothetical protein J5N97_026891 [Dioscorea zingiberensis]
MPHNGLSLCGGREMMVARLLSLEEAEKHRGYDRNDDSKYGQSQSSKYSRDDSSWTSSNAGRRESSLGTEPSGSVGWDQHSEEMIQVHGKGSAAALAPTLVIPQPELKPFTSKKGKSEPVLPASKWNREDDGSDEDAKASQGLGLSYSSSGSENAGGMEKVDDADMVTDAVFHHDSSMSEEHRKKLRRIEVAVMEYRESLEERGIRNSEEIEKKVAVHRKRLQSEFGLLDSAEGNIRQSSQKVERKERHEDTRDSSRKRHRSPSHSPQRKSSVRDREKEKKRETDATKDRNRHRDRSKSHETDGERTRDHGKSRSRERDDQDRDRRRKG